MLSVFAANSGKKIAFVLPAETTLCIRLSPLPSSVTFILVWSCKENVFSFNVICDWKHETGHKLDKIRICRLTKTRSK